MTWTLAVPGCACRATRSARRRAAIPPPTDLISGETRHDPATRPFHDAPQPARRPRAARPPRPQPRLDVGRGDRRRARRGRPGRARARLRQPRRDARRRRAGAARASSPPTTASTPAWRAPRRASTSTSAAPRWYETLPGAPGAIAYFSPEFGLSEALPQYSGGLGILAGDHLKAASDLGVPIVGIGLFYRNGYFRQLLTARGAQEEEFVDLDPALLPLAPRPGADGDARPDRDPAPGRDAARGALARRRRPRAAAAARHRRAGQRARRARRDRSPLRRRQRAPPAPGDPARHRRRQGARGVRHRARGVPHERGPRRLPRASSACASSSRAAPIPSTRCSSCARARSSRRTRRCPPASTASRTI